MLIRRALAALPLLFSLSVYAGETEDIQQLVKNKQWQQALTRADKFIANNPKDAQVRFLKGIVQTELGQPGEAIKTFSALAADYPQLPEPYNNLAVLYAQQNQIDKARAALLMAIQTNPSYAIAHENLGDLYARLASQSYDKALQLEGNNPNVKTKLKLVRELFSRAPVVAAKQQPAPTQKPAPAVKPVTPPPPKPEVKPTPQPPAASAQPAKPAQQDNRDADKQKVIAAVQAWAEAWSRQNVT